MIDTALSALPSRFFLLIGCLAAGACAANSPASSDSRRKVTRVFRFILYSIMLYISERGKFSASIRETGMIRGLCSGKGLWPRQILQET